MARVIRSTTWVIMCCSNGSLHNYGWKTLIQSRDRPIWLFWGQYWYIGHSWTDTQYFQNFLILFSASLSKILCILCLTFFSKTSKIRIYQLKVSTRRNFNILIWFLINLIDDDAFALAAKADACSMVHLVCLIMKMHLLALLQDNCLDLLCCAFLSKLSGCVRNITAFWPHLLRLINRAFWPIPIYRQNPNIFQLYQPGWYIGLSLI